MIPLMRPSGIGRNPCTCKGPGNFHPYKLESKKDTGRTMKTETTTTNTGKGNDKSSTKGNGKSGDSKPAATGAKSDKGNKGEAKASAAQTDAEPPASATATTPPTDETEQQKKDRLIAEAKAKIIAREEARKRKAQEDAEELAALERGELPKEKTRSSSGVMAQHVLNQVGAGARHVHKAIAVIEESITPENPASEQKNAALGFLRDFRKERMTLWQSKHDERVAAGEEMTHVLPLDLVTDDKGNVISVEKPKKPRAKKGDAPTTAA